MVLRDSVIEYLLTIVDEVADYMVVHNVQHASVVVDYAGKKQ